MPSGQYGLSTPSQSASVAPTSGPLPDHILPQRSCVRYMGSTRRAFLISFATQYVGIAVNLVSTIVISRLLIPAEIGIYSIAMAIAAVGHLLRDFGTGQYLIQEPELSTDRIRAAFTVTILFGWSIGGIVYLLADFAAAYFQHEAIGTVMELLTLNFLLLPFGSVTMAYLQRNMRFEPSMIASISATAVQAGVSITGAYLGYSYISLAWGSIAASCTSIGVAWYFRPRELPYLPGWRELRRILSFGTKISSATLLPTLTHSVRELVVGRMLGMTAVGLLSRSTGLVGMFQQFVLRGLNPVLTPLLAQIRREHGDLVGTFLYATECLTVLAWPFYACVAILAPELIVTLLGEQWASAGHLVQLMAIGQIVWGTIALAEQLFIATGRVGEIARLQLMITPWRLGLLFVGALHSLEMVVGLGILVSFIWFALVWPRLRALIDIGLAPFLWSLRRSAAIATLTTLSVVLGKFLVLNHLSSDNKVVLITSFVIGASTWMLSIWAGRHPLYGEMMNMLGRRRS